MNKHTEDVIAVALTEWMLTHQDDTGCREAAATLGDMGAMDAMLEMLDGPITVRCALEIATAFITHGEFHFLADLCQLREQFGQVGNILGVAIQKIEERAGGGTCHMCGEELQLQDEDGDGTCGMCGEELEEKG